MRIMHFKENLHFLMESRGLPIKELAALTGISENTIKSYLKEASAEPKISKAVQIAQALGVTVEYLATGKTEQKNTPPLSHQKLLADFEKLDATAQKAVSQMIETLAAR